MENCAFCGDEKLTHELIKGKSGSICSDCAKAATGIFLKHENEPSEMKETKTLGELKRELDKKVIGQENAKRQLLIEFYKHSKGNQSFKNNAFLIGNSGVGKTHLVRSLAKVFGVRLIEFDATMFSETGYKGKDVMDIIEEAYQQCNQDLEELKRSVILIDEIDKIITTTNSNGVTKIQQSLLKIVEGMEITLKKQGGRTRKETIVVDTKDLQFVVAGACVGLEEQINQKASPTRIGFGSGEPFPPEKATNYSVESEDLIEYGFIPEFVGRFPLIITLEPLTKEDYINILTTSEHSLIKDYIHVFNEENIVLEIGDEVVEMMAEQVQENKLGFRGVQSILTKRLNDLLFDSIQLEQDKIVLDTNNFIKDDNLIG